eukprot:519710_1
MSPTDIRKKCDPDVHVIDEISCGFYEELPEPSKFENYLGRILFEPCVILIPKWISPNSISVFNLLVCFMLLYISFLVQFMDNEARLGQIDIFAPLIARVFVAFCVFASTALDCFDGMHARNTGQTSKLGELLDHSFDAADSTIIALAVCLTVNFDAYTVGISVLATTMTYNAQLIIYKHRHVFIDPPFNGVESAMMSAALHIIWGLFAVSVNYDTEFMRNCRLPIAVVGNMIQFKNVWFYWKRLGPDLIIYQLSVMLQCLLPIIMFAIDVIPRSVFVIAFVLCSFRLNGPYVIYTLVGKERGKYIQFDMAVWFAIWAILLFCGISVGQHIHWALLVYVVTMTGFDFVCCYPEVR